MVRVKRGFAGRRKKRRIRKEAKGFRGSLRTRASRAKIAVRKALKHSTLHRKQKKTNMRQLWIARINAAVREAGLNYSRFIAGLKKHNISLDRRSLSDLAVNHAADFSKLIDLVKSK